MGATYTEQSDRGRTVVTQATISKLGAQASNVDRREHVKAMMAIDIAKYLLDHKIIQFVETEDSKYHVFKGYLELV